MKGRFGIESSEDVGKHYESCTPDYPEKPKDEAPQPISRVDLGDGEWVDLCGDCGAVMAKKFNGDE